MSACSFTDFAQGIVLLAAPMVAWLGLHTWREQKLDGKRIEISEQTLIDVSRVIEMIYQITSPALWPYEEENIKDRFMKEESGDPSNVSKQYQACLIRISDKATEIERILEKKYVVGAYFGKEGTSIYENIADFIRDIQFAAHRLIRRQISNVSAANQKDLEVAMDKKEADESIIWMTRRGNHERNMALIRIEARANTLFGRYLSSRSWLRWS
jgi:hypothetical protein